VEKGSIEQAHFQELEEHHKQWNNIILPNFENEFRLLELEMRKKHDNELQDFKKTQQLDMSMKFRPSPKLLDMHKKMESLASSGNYIEANKYKKQMKKIEVTELTLFNQHRQSKISHKS
jgi:hypothetical protein